MAIFFNETKNMKIYRKQVYFPLEPKNKLKNSLVMLLTPNIQSSIKTINSNLFVNKHFNSYYIERDISFFITQENFLQPTDKDLIPISESQEISSLQESCSSGIIYEQAVSDLKEQIEYVGLDYIIDESTITIINNDKVDTFLEADYTMTQSKYNQVLRQILYRERFRTPNDIKAVYDSITESCKPIANTYLTLERYKQKNLFVDFYYYNESFFKNNYLNNMKGLYLYLELINRFINDSRFGAYTTKHVFIPINDWKAVNEDKSITDYTNSINPISLIYRLLRKDMDKFKLHFANTNFVFYSDDMFFKMSGEQVDDKTYSKFIRLVNSVASSQVSDEDVDDDISSAESKSSIALKIIDKLENGKANIKIKNLTGDGATITEKEVIDKINNAASKASDEEEAIDNLENDIEFKELLVTLSSEQGSTMSAARAARMNTLHDNFMNKQIDGIKVKDLIDNSEVTQIPKTDLSKRLDTVNKEDWANITYNNFEDAYDMKRDVIGIINDLSNMSIPIGIRNIKIEDSSTSEDYKDTYTVECEDTQNKRFTFKFDVPKYKDGKFLRIKGNDKTIAGQLLLIPIIKTDPDTVQIVSNYNKIFIKRDGQKPNAIIDRCIKAIEKMPEIKKVKGNCAKANIEYDIDYAYDELGKRYNRIETKKYVIYCNQQEIADKFDTKSSSKTQMPYAMEKSTGRLLFTKNFSEDFRNLLSEQEGFDEIYDTCARGKKYIYSKANILNAKIPLILVCAYLYGLTPTLKKAGIKYKIVKKPEYGKGHDNYDSIRFDDAYIEYEITNESSLLMNGLKDVTTEVYSIGDIDTKKTWLECLDTFGNRVKLSDGLENFKDCMTDYITRDTLKYYNLPTDFLDILLYTNMLLTDTKYIDHIKSEGRRYRSNEIVAGYVYKNISAAYIDYKNKVKKGMKDATMSMKQSAVIDEVLAMPTAGDYSYGNAIGEVEAINAVSTKGLSGMNADRAYKADKRAYDKSMLGIMAMATNFAGNAGINRQMTIDANVVGSRGYLKIDTNPDDFSVTKTLSFQEALIPFGSTNNDGMRSAMDFIQTSKHQLRSKVSMPSLITNGADEALPYMVTSNFAFKAKHDGEVIKATDKYLILQYKDGTNDFVDLRKNIKKNSDGGFNVELKLDSEYKVGDKFKSMDIIAYDKQSFSDIVGNNENIAYSVGLLCKIAIMSTEEGYEDSTIITEWLSDRLSTEIVVDKEVTLNKADKIVSIAKKGQPVNEGDTIFMFERAYDEEDANQLMKNLSGDMEMVTDLGRSALHSKVTGWVEDIVIYRTVDLEELSPSIRSAVDDYEKEIKSIRKDLTKYKIDKPYLLNADYKLDPVGSLKDAADGVKIVFKLKYINKMGVGDKLVDYSAVKGVVRTIIPKGMEPTSTYRPNEKIHNLICTASLLARMCSAPIIVASLNKLCIELDRHCKDILGIKWKYIDEMM